MDKGMVTIFAVALAAWGPPTMAEDSETRTIAVTVVTRGGEEVTGLTAADFSARSQGTTLRILSAVQDTSRRRVALVVDSSESAGQGRRWTGAWKAAEAVIGALTPAHEVMLLTLAQALRQESGLSDETGEIRESARRAMARGPSGSSAIFDGLAEASAALTKAPAVDRLLLISDGDDTSSRLSSSEVASVALKAGLRVFWLRTEGPENDRNDRWLDRPAQTRELVEATGGVMFDLTGRTGDKAERELRRACHLLTLECRLQIALPMRLERPQKWKLAIQRAGGERTRQLKIEGYPRLLMPSLPD